MDYDALTCGETAGRPVGGCGLGRGGGGLPALPLCRGVPRADEAGAFDGCRL